MAAAATYWKGGGRDHLGEAYRIGTLVGLNTRIFDDILDGDAEEEAENPERFVEHYLDSIEEGEPARQKNGAEQAALRAAAEIGETCDREKMIGYWKDLTDVVMREDKTSIEGYKQHARNAGGMVGELVVASISHLEDFEAGTEEYSFGYDLGHVGMVADDMMDEEILIPEERAEKIFSQARERVSRHGLMGIIASSAAPFYPSIYQGMKKAVSMSRNHSTGPSSWRPKALSSGESEIQS